MIKFKTEADVINYFSSEKEALPTLEFQEGAQWAIKINEEYMAHLQKRITSLNEKIKELNEKLYEYDVLYFGAEPVATKKTRKKSKGQSSEGNEREEMLAEMESMYGFNPEDDDDYDIFGFED